jgi:hypothetical protein
MSPASERDIAEQRAQEVRAAEEALRAEFLTPARAVPGPTEESSTVLLKAFLRGAGIQVHVCGSDGRPLSPQAVEEFGKFYARIIAREPYEAPLPITAEQAATANGLIERHAPAGEATTAVQVALGNLALWIETGRTSPRPSGAVAR